MSRRVRRLRRGATKKLPLVGLAVLAVVTMAVVGYALMPQPQAPVTAPPAPLATTRTVEAVKFAAVGDSITEANSPDIIGGVVGSGSWVSHAAGNGLVYAGGWADGGAQTKTMASSVKPVDAGVLVVLAGTNDFTNSVPFAESKANIESIVATVGAERVIVAATPPNNSRPELGKAYNADLEAFAAANGWEWVDATADIRTPANTYLDGMTSDGTHPTTEAARMIGESIRAAIL